MGETTKKVCPDCGGEMEAGVLVRQHGFGNVPVDWVAGEPGGGGFFSSGVPAGPRRPVVTYRCTECGLLKSYVPETQ